MTYQNPPDPEPYHPTAGVTPDRPRRLVRSRDNAWLGGICGGLAEYFGWDATVVRVAFVLSMVLPGPQVLIYLLLWLVIPKARR